MGLEQVGRTCRAAGEAHQAAQFVDVPNLDTPALQIVEEAEEVLYSEHSLLMRFRDGEWQEQGRRGAKLLFHRKTGKVLFVMRHEETMIIVNNFDVADVLSHTELVPNADLNAWCWQAIDFCFQRVGREVHECVGHGKADLSCHRPQRKSER